MVSARFPFASFIPALLAIAISAAGGGLAMLIGLPAGWLMGGALAVTIAVMAGVKLAMPDRLRDVIFVMIGMSMGASVHPDSLSLLSHWPVSIAALALELIIIVATTGWMLHRLFKLDAGTAYLSSFPGHLSLVMGIAASGVGNARQIVIIQVIRILMLTIAVPIGAVFLPDVGRSAVVATQIMGPFQVLLLALVCTLGGLALMATRMPAGLVLGAMAAAMAPRLGGLYTEALPPVLVTTTFVLTGALIGTRFVGISRAEVVAAAKGGLIATAMTVAIVTIITVGMTQLVDMPFGQVWLALSPGALEGMGALGIALGYDTAFIAGHHVLRLMMLSFAIPLVAVLIRRQEKSAQGRHNRQA